RDDTNTPSCIDHVEPWFGEMHAETGMPIAAQHRLVRWRYPLRKDIAVDAPARAVIELPKAEKEPRKRRPFRFVDLGQVRSTHEHVRLSRTGLQSHGGIAD